MEIFRLRRGRGRLKPDEYFMYELYDDARYTPEAKQTFLGQSNMMFDSPWTEIARDKQIMSALLQGLGLPTPETQAIVHSTRTYPGAAALRGRDDVCRFLRSEANYPIFGKPFDCACSVGTAKITGYDKAEDAVIVGDGHRIPVEKIADLVENLGRAYLFQTLMLPHDSIENLIGPCVSSVRMFVMSDENGCDLFRASWKIPASANDADNFWRAGNMLAGVDVETGKIGRTLIRTGGATEPIETHPITNVKFSEMTFPHWDQMRDVVLSAAKHLPSCHFQGWDVAMTDRGPVLVELEGDGGNPIMEQLCFDSGLLNERYLAIIDRIAEREKEGQADRRKRGRQEFKQSIVSLASAKPSADASPAADEQETVELHDVAELQETAQLQEVAEPKAAEVESETKPAPIVVPGSPGGLQSGANTSVH
ncbi:hypothetical protein Mal15_28300 [Stieleria maiorica]|uniref:Alpha-L-glutamate ligase-related protein ATP-grasp domain-containing protein n=2 Tax=Stieleria maiorica TaxID=2795974 RepID=A0A5B9MGP7_9BACT|nr:hypothetical protein Mal15_28300 [Stieleria maiorica]